MSIKDLGGRLRDGARALFDQSFVVRKPHGGHAFSMPLIFGILLIVFALKIVLILVIVGLAAGYRVSVERR